MSLRSLRFWLEKGELEDLIIEPAWLYVGAAAVLLVGVAMFIALQSSARYDALHAIEAQVEQQAAQTQGARSTIYPANTIVDVTNGYASVTNCTGAPVWCREKVIHQVSTDGDHYIGYATLTKAIGPQEVITYTTTGFTGGVAQNVTITSRTIISANDSLLYASIPATSISTDSRNPGAPAAAAYLAAVGASPVVRSINWGQNLDVGNNNLELVKYSIHGVSATTGMAIAALPAKNLKVVTGFVTPTPFPNYSNAQTTQNIVYHWPAQAGGPSTFTAKMPFYHDAYFAEGPREQGFASDCAEPNPAYQPGSSPTYIPGNGSGGMFGTAGPWVYPVPNPLSPVGQDAGPATFNVSPLTAGLCTIAVYTTYTPRSGTIFPGEPQPADIPVQVMGQIIAAPSSLSWSSPTQTSAQTTVIGKTYDQQQLSPTIINNSCGGIVTLAWGSISTPPTPSVTPASVQLIVTPVTNASGHNVGGSCSFQVESQYAGEPPTTVTINERGQLRTWPAAVKFASSGQTFLASVDTSQDPIAWVNRMFAGANAIAASPCKAQAFTDASYSTPDAGPPSNVAALLGAQGVSVDARGCYMAGGAPANAPLAVWEPDGSTQTYAPNMSSCGSLVAAGSWYPSVTASAASLATAGGSGSGNCTVSISDGSGVTATSGQGLVAAQVVASLGFAQISLTYATQPGGCNVGVDPGCFNTSHDDEYYYQFDGSQWSNVAGTLSDDSGRASTNRTWGTIPDFSSIQYSGIGDCLGGISWVGSPPPSWVTSGPPCQN